MVAAANVWGVVLAGRVVDRLGKGARTAPRDALIRDSTPPPLLGAAFGYHRALDTAGAVVGPIAAVILLATGMSLRNVLWIAVLPGFLALLLLRAVREAPRHEVTEKSTVDAGPLPRSFWAVVVIWAVFSLGNSSDVFLILRSSSSAWARPSSSSRTPSTTWSTRACRGRSGRPPTGGRAST